MLRANFQILLIATWSKLFRKSLTHHAGTVIIVGHRYVRKFYHIDVNLSMKLTLMLEYTILSCCATAAFSVEFRIKYPLQTCFRAAISCRRPLYDCHSPPSGPIRYDECCGMWNVDIACCTAPRNGRVTVSSTLAKSDK